jgi:hypothetical protein
VLTCRTRPTGSRSGHRLGKQTLQLSFLSLIPWHATSVREDIGELLRPLKAPGPSCTQRFSQPHGYRSLSVIPGATPMNEDKIKG